MTQLVRRDGDWAGVVAAAQRDASDDQAWAQAVVDSLAGLLFTQYDATVAVVEHSPSCDSARYLALPSTPATTPLIAEIAPDAGLSALSALGVGGFRSFYYPSRTTTTHREIERDKAAMIDRDAASALRERSGIIDVVGVFAYPEPGVVISLFASHDRTIHMSSEERKFLTRIALHLESSFRLRRRPEALAAVLDLDGRVIQRDEGAPPDEVLTAHLRQRQRAISERGASASIDLWPALISGRLSLIERGSGKARRYLAVTNPPSSQPVRALSAGELEVVSQAARGRSSKLIAYALGITPAAVSQRMTSAASKLGAATRAELVRIAAMLTGDPRARFAKIVLTDAEEDVLELLQHGLSNDQIATMRSRSIRTIANQVAALLRKTGSASRRELLVGPRRRAV
jgi:DNA-binding CsgD family transcriptional regulator